MSAAKLHALPHARAARAPHLAVPTAKLDAFAVTLSVTRPSTFTSASSPAQVHFSVIDLELHARFKPGAGESVFDRDAAVAKKTQVRRARVL